MSEDDGIRIDLKPVARSRAQGAQQRRSRKALKLGVAILIAALVVVMLGPWGTAHLRQTEFVGVICGAVAQQMVPPRLRWIEVSLICVGVGLVLALLTLFGT